MRSIYVFLFISTFSVNVNTLHATSSAQGNHLIQPTSNQTNVLNTRLIYDYVFEQVDRLKKNLAEHPESIMSNDLFENINQIYPKSHQTLVIRYFLVFIHDSPQYSKYYGILSERLNAIRANTKLPVQSQPGLGIQNTTSTQTHTIWRTLKEYFDSEQYKKFVKYIHNDQDVVNFFNYNAQHLEELANMFYTICLKHENNITYPVKILFKINNFKEHFRKVIIENIFTDPFNEQVIPQINSFKQFNFDILDEYLEYTKLHISPYLLQEIGSTHLYHLDSFIERIKQWILTLLKSPDWSVSNKNNKTYHQIALLDTFFEASNEIIEIDFWLQFSRLLTKGPRTDFWIKHEKENYEKLQHKLIENITGMLHRKSVNSVEYFDQRGKLHQNLLQRLEHTKLVRSAFYDAEKTPVPWDYQDKSETERDTSFKTNYLYLLANSKFDYASTLDFAGISKLPLRKPVKVYVSEPDGVRNIDGLNCRNCIFNEMSGHSHGTEVASIIRSIAPFIVLEGGYFYPDSISGNTDIVNLSWSHHHQIEDGETKGWIKNLYKRITL